jgi:hypothetical protein
VGGNGDDLQGFDRKYDSLSCFMEEINQNAEIQLVFLQRTWPEPFNGSG